MKRKTITEKLFRIIETIEAGETPVAVCKLWIYGSYARGALECGDLDIAIVIDYPDQKRLDELVGKGWILDQMDKFQQKLKYSLKKRGEQIDIQICNSEESIHDFFKNVPVNDAILIWSEEVKDWKTRIDSIKPNPMATRFQRSYPIELKRTGTTRETMEQVLWLVDQGYLKMKILDMDKIEIHLSLKQKEKLQFWRARKIHGQNTLDVLPYAFDWFRREKKLLPKYLPFVTEIESVSGSHLVHIGKIDFEHALGWLYSNKKARKLCLIPHLRKRSINEMFIIERDSKWSGDLFNDLNDK